ncbi:MAG: DUF1573 domain-containing protein [Pirellulaceae bacterium]
MKTWWILLASSLVGLAIGVGLSVQEQRTSLDLYFPEDFAARAKQLATASEPVVDVLAPARVEVVGDAVFDFGSMERQAKMQHTFQLKNVGTSDLILEPGKTTCKCTVSKVSLRTVPVGAISEVILEWTGQTMSPDPDFAQTADIKTSDPNHPTVQLKIQGYVTDPIRALPDELVVGDVPSNSGSEAEFRLYGFRSDRMEILETVWEVPETAAYFDISYEPLALPEVKKEKGATCGLLARVTMKPGLPLGPINQTIRVRANLDKEVVVAVPVKGRTLSDIRIASSPEFDSNRNLLSLGALKQTDERKVVLRLYVTGSHRHETQLSIGELDPPGYFKVDIGPPKELNGGKAVQFLVTIEIPAGQSPINRQGAEEAGWGRVVLKTTHPQTQEVPIRVKFSVE